ncbi:MAG: DMT family transporter [Pseudotabrizicola sp.]|uniref:DMT family transporter n=1 Tax=Pseudotabrizicola sp. TaxID=2939647 RepID=UPI00271D4B3B|nr:DMT family transporter [Pseudotabrizicola sp.]MDO8882787.1 DMT family transporter [Pseudotabrizicola sp.]MDP2082828.1 DMT family transporter [Pseudotabrizicola sp.]MDZ7576199.1 DMT family transporter [Pseudotabrizicola sp.]
MKTALRTPLVLGVGFLVASTLAATLADGTVKDLSARLEAPQVFFLSGLIMAGLSLLAARAGSRIGLFTTSCLKTTVPGLLLWRSVATVVASLGFFYAIAMIPLAEIFLFVGLMPLMSALMSRHLLGESVDLGAWAGLGLGLLGVLMLFPNGLSGLSMGHFAGFAGALAGTVSLVLSRLMARREVNTLVQVFYPNLALAGVAALMLPAIWQPLGMADVARICLYSGLLFLARWTMVMVMQRLRAPVALPLMNIQFVWMVGVGFVFFGEVPAATTILGALLVMSAGGIALLEQARVDKLARTSQSRSPGTVPAE